MDRIHFILNWWGDYTGWGGGGLKIGSNIFFATDGLIPREANKRGGGWRWRAYERQLRYTNDFITLHTTIG